uniref:Uncharacterized protein n=1 Tax=Lepeophtheirus salmonis TaxID=72036 RepID=A0A0K2TV69_LEPSM
MCITALVIINVATLRSNDGFQAGVEGLAFATDVILRHGVLVLAVSGFEGLGVWMTDTTVHPLYMHPKFIVKGVGIRGVGRPKVS